MNQHFSCLNLIGWRQNKRQNDQSMNHKTGIQTCQVNVTTDFRLKGETTQLQFKKKNQIN